MELTISVLKYHQQMTEKKKFCFKETCWLLTLCRAPMAVMPEMVMLTAIKGERRAEIETKLKFINQTFNVNRCQYNDKIQEMSSFA